MRDFEKLLSNKKIEKIFVLAGKNSFFKSKADKIFKNCLKDKKVKFYFKKSYYPEFIELKKIMTKLKRFNPDFVLAIGGGSVLDYAKMANVLKISSQLGKDIATSNYTVHKKFFKLLAIPTTAGSGAEVTANAVVYLNKKKYSIEDEQLKPDYFSIVPELIITSSKSIKSSAGFDAIAQSLESLVSVKSNSKSVNFAKKSLALSFKNYLAYINKPNKKNTYKMALAANLSGKAISITKTTAPHALSYPFTAHFNISHGHAVSLTINQFMKFNYHNHKRSKTNFDLKKRFKTIFKIAKVKDINEFDKLLVNIKKKARLENNLKKLNINIHKDFSKIISGVNLLRLKNNPIDIEQSDLKKILFSIN